MNLLTLSVSSVYNLVLSCFVALHFPSIISCYIFSTPFTGVNWQEIGLEDGSVVNALVRQPGGPWWAWWELA